MGLQTGFETEPGRLGDVLAFEEDGFYSRDAVTVKAGAGLLPVGAVIGRVTATGEVAFADPTAADGSEVAIGILIEEVAATGTEALPGVAVLRHAALKRQGLVFGPGVTTAAHKTTIEGELAAAGLLIREGA